MHVISASKISSHLVVTGLSCFIIMITMICYDNSYETSRTSYGVYFVEPVVSRQGRYIMASMMQCH